ncbi:MAG: hypothetical protein ACOX6T_16470 [Myxococcales bacterium]|jgi:hypothetical protein
MTESSTAPKIESSEATQPAPEPAGDVVGQPAVGEPLPIWFFVGLILLVYGVIIVGSGLFSKARPTVLAETRPALWWGGIMSAVGAVFLAAGWKIHRSHKP